MSRILAAELANPVDPKSAGRLAAALSVLVDNAAAATLLNFVSATHDRPEVIAIAEGVAGDGAHALWLREISALHGQAIRLASLIDGQDPDGWRDVTRRVFFDQTEARWTVQLHVTKNDGTPVFVSDSTPSVCCAWHST